MLLTQELKRDTLAAIREDFAQKKQSTRSYTQSRHATYLGINTSVYSRISNNDTDKVLSDGEWIRIARKLNVPSFTQQWQAARTRTFRIITGQLQACMLNSIGGIFCDDSSLGKTFACKHFALSYANVAYVDCSGVKTWPKLIRAIAAAFGFPPNGKLHDLRQTIIDNVLSLDNPLIILDEAGDLDDSAILSLKGLWNELESLCGWYMVGANGLRAKMERKLANNKVGYEEMFNRLGNRFQNVTGTMTIGEKDILKRGQIEQIAKANAPDLTVEQLAEVVSNCDGNARRVRVELLKLSKASKSAA